MPEEGNQSMPLSLRRSASSESRGLLAAFEHQTGAHALREPGRDLRCERRGKRGGLEVGQEVDVGLDGRVGSRTETQDAERYPRVRGRDDDVDGRAVPGPETLIRSTARVEPHRHEDRAALGVEVEHLGRVRRQEEAVLAGPVPDRGPATLQHDDVERIDLGLQDHLSPVLRRTGRGGRERERLGLWLGFLHQTLERPVTAPDHLRRNAGQRDDRTELPLAAGELERCDVVLDPLVVSGERRGSNERDAPIGVDEPTARPCRRGDEQYEESDGDRERQTEVSHR